MKKILLTSIILFFLVFEGVAQNTDSLINLGKELLDKGSVYFDESYLIEAEQKFQEVLIQDDYNYIAQYFLAYTYYRLAVFYLINRDDEQFKNYIKLSETELGTILDSSNTNAEALSLLASDYGEEIRANNNLAAKLAPKALLLISKALKNDPDNPRVQLLAGKLILTLPEKFGGNKVKSLVHLKKSVKLFEENQDADDLLGWGYIFALSWLGINYAELNDYVSAVSVYNKALEVEPDFAWINNILLPDAQKKLNTDD